MSKLLESFALQHWILLLFENNKQSNQRVLVHGLMQVQRSRAEPPRGVQREEIASVPQSGAGGPTCYSLPGFMRPLSQAHTADFYRCDRRFLSLV